LEEKLFFYPYDSIFSLGICLYIKIKSADFWAIYDEMGYTLSQYDAMFHVATAILPSPYVCADAIPPA